MDRRGFLRGARAMAAALVAGAALAACQPVGGGLGAGAGAAGGAVDASGPTRVALLVPGGGGTDGLLSANLENAARLGLAQGGGNVDLAVYQTGGTPAGGQAAAQRAIAEGAALIIGPLYAQAANGAGLAAAPAGINVLAFSNDTSIAGGNVFVLGPTFENTAGRLLSYAARQGRGRVIVTAEQGARGDAAIAAVQRAAARSGATVVSAVRYAPGQAEIARAGNDVAATARSAGADTVLYTSDPARGLTIMAAAVRSAGLQPPEAQLLGLARWDVPPTTLSEPGLQGGWFTRPDPRRSAAFESAYQSAYGAAPHPLAFVGYDAALAASTLVATGRRDALSGRSLTRAEGFGGGAGAFRLLPDGTVSRALAIAEVRGGQAVIVDAAPGGAGS